ncbi:hypothetical protein V8F20_003984 [Naviculisporaceae sp. PSN 640]
MERGGQNRHRVVANHPRSTRDHRSNRDPQPSHGHQASGDHQSNGGIEDDDSDEVLDPEQYERLSRMVPEARELAARLENELQITDPAEEEDWIMETPTPDYDPPATEWWGEEVFNEKQKNAFQDVFAALGNSIPGAQVDEYSMWRLVFRDDWNTTKPLGAAPVVDDRSGGQVMFGVGKFNQDLQKSGGSKDLTSWRKKGEKAFIKLFVDRKNPTQHPFAFCDSHGAMAAKACIEFDKTPWGRPYEVGHFLIEAVTRFDELELARVKSYNVNLARYIIRNRLKHWANHGWTPDTVVPDEDALFAKFTPPKYARDDPFIRKKCQIEVSRGQEKISEDELPDHEIDEKLLWVPDLLKRDEVVVKQGGPGGMDGEGEGEVNEEGEGEVNEEGEAGEEN